MREILFITTGGLGFLFIVLFGNYLLKHPETSSRCFAGFIGGSFAILVPSLLLLTREFNTDNIVLSLILAVINFGVGYPLAYFFHQYRFKTP